jgi:hypothetical protein
MQGNIKLIIYTIAGLFVLWFIALTVNRNIFLHTDIDGAFYGTVAMNKTDIGDQCGSNNSNNYEIIEYKLNARGQIVYLCPQDLWPIQKIVIAATVSDDLRRTFAPVVQKRIATLYPPPAQPAVPALNTAPPPPDAAPAPQQQPAASTPFPKPLTHSTPAQPAVNPFIQPGAQAPATQAPAPASAPAQQQQDQTQQPQAPLPVGPVSSAPPAAE